MKYTIVTSCTAISEYTVEANSKEEAEEKFWDSDYLDEKITDYQDEEITEVKENDSTAVPVS
jgi:hypothetical protein